MNKRSGGHPVIPQLTDLMCQGDGPERRENLLTFSQREAENVGHAHPGLVIFRWVLSHRCCHVEARSRPVGPDLATTLVCAATGSRIHYIPLLTGKFIPAPRWQCCNCTWSIAIRVTCTPQDEVTITSIMVSLRLDSSGNHISFYTATSVSSLITTQR
jgi:hypothetical protein